MEKPKILVLFYSMYGHIYEMMQAAAEGVKEAGGEPFLRQVKELIPKDKWNEGIKAAKEKMKDVPITDIHGDLANAEGILLGIPTRFGNMPAQMRNFWDQTSDEWMKGSLIGKPVAIISSSATQHGGQETTIITSLVTMLHHGMIYVGLPYSVQEQMTLDEIAGGSPYGASTITGGQGERMPSDLEKKMAREQGKRLAEITKKLMA